MFSLDAKAIETLAIGAVKDSVVVSDFMDQFISDNDKEPSWDGNVYIYKGKGKKKSMLRGRVPVQVKGHETDDLSLEEIYFSVSVADLNNYLNDGGVIFFVVYIHPDGKQKQIYYASLPPVNVKFYLDRAKAQNYKSTSVKLKKFPDDVHKKTIIFLNCLENCRKQASFSNADLRSLEELDQEGVLEGITIPFLTVEGVDAETALLNGEVYVYAQIKGSAIAQPINAVPEHVFLTKEVPACVSIGEITFYNKIKFSRDAEKIIIFLGESISIMLKEKRGAKLSYKGTCNLRQLVIDLHFMLSYMEEGYFAFNGAKYTFDRGNADFTNFSIEDEKRQLQHLKKTVQMLDFLGCKKDINLASLSDRDWRNIDTLINGLIDKEVVSGLREDLCSVMPVEIGELTFFIFLEKETEEKGKYRLYDFFQISRTFLYKNSTGKNCPISQYAVLGAEDLLKAENLRLDKLLPSFQKEMRHEETMERASFFMLQLVLAYDKSGKPEFLDTAKAFSDWIMTDGKNEIPYYIRRINDLQIIKRQRALEPKEIEELFEIIEKPNTPEDVLAGAYLLVDQPVAAKRHLDKLDNSLQDEFKKYPIWRFGVEIKS